MKAEENTDDAERAFKAIFRRLGRIAIESGLTAPQTYRLMKEALVESAVEDFPLEEKRLTDSRISLLTGVHRKDVRTIRERTAQPAAPAGKPSIIATVIGRWLGDLDLRDADGTPRPLPRQAETGHSFDALVESVTTDMRPRTLLDELERTGAVAFDVETDTVTLTERAMIGTDRDALYFLGHNAGDHIAAIASNISRDEATPPMLERAVFYTHMDASAVDTLELICREGGMALLEKVNEAALARQSTGDDTGERFRFGIYFYRESETGLGED